LFFKEQTGGRKYILELTNILRKLAFSNIHAPEKLGNFSSIINPLKYDQ
jgi:hypothetical protein